MSHIENCGATFCDRVHIRLLKLHRCKNATSSRLSLFSIICCLNSVREEQSPAEDLEEDAERCEVGARTRTRTFATLAPFRVFTDDIQIRGSNESVGNVWANGVCVTPRGPRTLLHTQFDTKHNEAGTSWDVASHTHTQRRSHTLHFTVALWESNCPFSFWRVVSWACLC